MEIYAAGLEHALLLSVAGGGVEVPADAGNGGCCEAAATACCWRC